MPGFLEYRLDIGKVSELPLTTLSIPAEHGRGRCLRGVHIVAHSTVLTLARSQYSTCEVLVLTLFCVLIRCQSCRAQHASASPSRLCASSSCARTSTRCAPCNQLSACNQPATNLQPTYSLQSMLRWLRLPVPLYMPYWLWLPGARPAVDGRRRPVQPVRGVHHGGLSNPNPTRA